VAQQSGRFTVGFSPGVTESGLTGVGLSDAGAGRGWHRACGTVPCRRAWRWVLDEAEVHWNTMHTLLTLGGPVTSTRHGRGEVYGGS
jgi:hypothetical protein